MNVKTIRHTGNGDSLLDDSSGLRAAYGRSQQRLDSTRERDERRAQLYAERLAIGYEQARQAERLAEIRALLRDLEEDPRDG